jgi:hypothetical protein
MNETRQEHANRLIAGLNKILNEACKSCVNHFFCYKQKKDGTLFKKYKKCSKMPFERKMELIGELCYYHPTLNPKGFVPNPIPRKKIEGR